MNANANASARSRGRCALPWWKRAIDIAFCLAAMPLLAPLGLSLWIAMRRVCPGPLLFRQERIGQDGRTFICLKFRTMVVGPHTAVHRGHCAQLIGSKLPMTKMETRGDSRLIPGGWLLRSSGLDELPQIINIWRGEMSLVGPRPCTSYEYDQYKPWQRERFVTVPGLTGLWQVSGKNKTTFDEMINLDIDYAHSLSPWLDLKIILRTLPTLVLQTLEVRRKRTSPAPTAQANVVITS